MNEQTAATPRWVSVHLYFHGELDDVVSQVVGPLAQAVSPQSAHRQYFYLRYWEGGPHVRLRIRTDGQGIEVIEDRVRSHAESFFARNKSDDRVDADAYRAIREWAVGFEPWSNPSTELRPNNSMQFEPYQPEHDKYGYGSSLAAVEQHFMESSEIARDAVDRRMPGTERALLALCALVTGWAIGHPDPGEFIGWVRTGAPLFDRAAEAAEGSRHEWLTAQQEALSELVKQTVTAAHSTTTDTQGRTLRQRWRQSVIDLRTRLVNAPRNSTARDAPSVIDNCGHLLCNRLGLSPGREAAIRSIARRALIDAEIRS